MPQPEAVLRRSIGEGEREALALAVEIQAERILLDDRPARRVALDLNLLVNGSWSYVRFSLDVNLRPGATFRRGTRRVSVACLER
jgi:predicted nucleic acid-binding protein